MARTFSRSSQVYPAGNYGPFEVNGRQLGDVGAHITFTRSNDGTWPLTSNDTVLTIFIEGLYETEWHSLVRATFAGGTLPALDGSTKLSEFLTVYWPMKRVSNPTRPDTPHPPDAVRLRVNVAAALRTAVNLQWLS